MPTLKVQDLVLHYKTRKGPVKAVDHISFELEKGHTLAVVGESGCGKTSTAAAILRLLPKNIARYDGEVYLDGADVMKLSEEEFRKDVRWQRISMVFQGAMNALNPTARVGMQVAEPLKVHLAMKAEEAKALVSEALDSVGLPPYVEKSFPHELSGGMKQRVVIAMALIMKPRIVILDEPTSALDVMTQANVINLLKRLKKEEDLSYMFITHDFSLASELADEVAIMYAGELAEIGPSERVYEHPKHPYTEALLRSVPRLRSSEAPEFIPGVPPDLVEPPSGCRFHPRCPVAFEPCGWIADEVATDLELALEERGTPMEIRTGEEISTEDDLTLVLRPTAGIGIDELRRTVREILASESDRLRSLRGVKEIHIKDGAIVIRLHEGRKPHPFGEKQRAACLLLENGGT